jgi:hypothetical protein
MTVFAVCRPIESPLEDAYGVGFSLMTSLGVIVASLQGFFTKTGGQDQLKYGVNTVPW